MLRIRSAVSSSAGRNVSSASSDSVMSTGVPKIMVVEMKLRTSSLCRSLKGIATLSDDSGAERLEDLVPALRELRRVLRVGGVLRLSLPDLDRGYRAYAGGDRDYFLVPDDDASSLGGKLVTQLLWYGHSRSLFTADFIEELLRRAGFGGAHCGFRETRSGFPEMVQLDDRERESLFVEAVK